MWKQCSQVTGVTMQMRAVSGQETEFPKEQCIIRKQVALYCIIRYNIKGKRKQAGGWELTAVPDRMRSQVNVFREKE